MGRICRNTLYFIHTDLSTVAKACGRVRERRIFRRILRLGPRFNQRRLAIHDAASDRHVVSYINLVNKETPVKIELFRYGASVDYRDSLIIVGGTTSGGQVDTVWFFNHETDPDNIRWEEVAQLSVPRQSLSAFMVPDDYAQCTWIFNFAPFYITTVILTFEVNKRSQFSKTDRDFWLIRTSWLFLRLHSNKTNKSVGISFLSLWDILIVNYNFENS